MLSSCLDFHATVDYDLESSIPTLDFVRVFYDNNRNDTRICGLSQDFRNSQTQPQVCDRNSMHLKNRTLRVMLDVFSNSVSI